MEDEDWQSHPRTQALRKYLRQRRESQVQALINGARTLDLESLRLMGYEIMLIELLIQQIQRKE